MKIGKYSFGVGDRFAREGVNQLRALVEAEQKFGVHFVPVWNKSNREHQIVGTEPMETRREAVRQILKDAGSFLDDGDIAALEKLGFRYISGKNHHKLEWAGIRFPMAKTPSDHRSCLNSAAEIINRVF